LLHRVGIFQATPKMRGNELPLDGDTKVTPRESMFSEYIIDGAI
jgi:hypothetical protein